MLDGILDIRLLPRWAPSSVQPDLMAALSRARSLQAGIGYWTIDEGLLGPDLARTLGADGGFACVDLHLPTDVDALAALARQGAHVRIYYEDIPTFADNGRREPPWLLHAKMLLFRLADGTAELWVGSHNWTNRALLGLNVEASLVVRLRDTAPLFRAAEHYLSAMRRIAEPFNPADVDAYKDIQRRIANGLTPVVELRSTDRTHLDGETIALFGTDTSDLALLGTIRRGVHVAVHRPCVGQRDLYPATIVHSGLLAASEASAGGIMFSPRRHAFRQGRQMPSLQAEGPVDRRIVETARYFVTLHLGRRQTLSAGDHPGSRRGIVQEVGEEMSALLHRMDPATRERLFRRKRPRVKRAAVVGEETTGLRTAMANRGGDHDHPLVAMRVVRGERSSR